MNRGKLGITPCLTSRSFGDKMGVERWYILKNEKKGVYWTLFRTCFLISCCTFGGGMVIISLLQKKFVEDLKWISQDEVMDMVAIAQSCPGVMAVNTSIIIGYHVAGVLGALLTVLGTVTPPMIILTLISCVYVQFRSNVVVALVLKGMQAGVAAVLINVAVTMTANALKSKTVLSWVLLIGAVTAVVFLGVDMILTLVACGAVGAIVSLAAAKKGGAA